MKTKPHGKKFRLTIADMGLIGGLLLLNGFLLLQGTVTRAGSVAIIDLDQQEYARVSLYDETVVHVPGPLGDTEVEIRDGRARILRSPCANKVCIKSGSIRYADRIVACIPNRVVVRIAGPARNDVDSILG
ncbi:MAG: hypothetical protein G3M78_13960 [Candidatus Nitrohelix vancouverensis]|uniref:NusG domain-containing protein n=1 Tax=Candidatus Nitrohelix vancouverensis TaxID=2705534 RepID=A0A7T0C4N1_9BACT|nr:MAG: hypothetical protein G3M78_13960 [Candidatus Nitrohelix vancouverensis]